MTKADLIDEVSRLAELTRKDSEVIVETIFDSVVRSLRAGDKIEIRGFGSFRTRQRKPRTGRNPKTGEKVEVPAKKIPFFKPSKEVKDLVNAHRNFACSVVSLRRRRPCNLIYFGLVTRYKSATFSAISCGLTSIRLASTMMVKFSSGKRWMVVRNPTVSP